ncbi:hypothetical protein C9374_003718 [Naegleria lovaniensis]|uniref:BRO1 domain-containing protein n=1 Tax=Naegleria lovaniensis TaxID=51637 RepID=A0AA88KST9_NAELO|nr:uncharacterized protein C9374_003718 [Naegleria lovaniensis]KAG2393954.1 hypothetical protein C9374_003718 [Naegleria lovaniensis]
MSQLYLLVEFSSEGKKSSLDGVHQLRTTREISFTKLFSKFCSKFDEHLAELLSEKRNTVIGMMKEKKYNEELCNKIMDYLSVFCGLAWNLSISPRTSNSDSPVVVVAHSSTNDLANDHNSSEIQPYQASASGNGDSAVLIREEIAEEDDIMEVKTLEQIHTLTESEQYTHALPTLSHLQYIAIYDWWNESFGKVETNDALYEMLMMLSTAAVSLTQAATEKSDYKTSLQLLMKATSIWKFCECHVSPQFHHSNPTNMKFVQSNSVNMCKLMSLLSRAQAQEVAIKIATEKGITQLDSLAKLCRFVFEKYSNALKLIPQNESCVTKLKSYLLLKVRLYDIMSHMYSAFHYNKNDENGKAIKLIDEAMKMFDSLSKSIKKEYMKMLFDNKDKTHLENQFNYLESELNRFKEKYALENTMVYHQTIPETVPQVLESKELGHVEEFEFPEPHTIWQNASLVYAKFELGTITLQHTTEMQQQQQPSVEAHISSENQIEDEFNDFIVIDSSQIPPEACQNIMNKPQKRNRRNQDDTSEGPSLCIIL